MVSSHDNSRSSKPGELDLRPGSGVGPFELGSSLWSILDFLQQHAQKSLYPQIDVKYDVSSPATSPVLLHIRPHLDLLFSPRNQRLGVINLRRLRTPGHGLVVRYRDKIISSSSSIGGGSAGTVLRRANVNQVFGPTYSGHTMKYPGLAIGFEDDGPLTQSAPGYGVEDRNQEVKRIVVMPKHRGEDERDALDEPLESASMYGELRKATVQLNYGPSTSIIALDFYAPSSSSAPTNTLVEVRLGRTTAQDLAAELGWPPRVHYKDDDRMTIHKAAASSNNGISGEENNGYFMNYFQYGFDVLVAENTHIVQKFILHSNVPGSYLFQRYKRCSWEIVLSPNVSQTSQSPPIPTLSLPPVIEDSLYVEPTSSKGLKKGKKKATTPVKPISPAPNLIQLTPELSASPLPLPTEDHKSGLSIISLYDKIDLIKSALADFAPRSTAVHPGTPITSTRSQSPQTFPLGARLHSHVASGSSPQAMILDRSSDVAPAERSTLITSTSKLMGFDNVVLEVSELGDVLSVMVY